LIKKLTNQNTHKIQAEGNLVCLCVHSDEKDSEKLMKTDFSRQFKSDMVADPELIDILMKYGDNEFCINPLSYAIYRRDYNAALTLLKHGFNPNIIENIQVVSPYKGGMYYYSLTPIDFLFVEEMKGTKNGSSFYIPICDGRSMHKGKITFRLFSKLPEEEVCSVKELLHILLLKMDGQPSYLNGFISEIGREGSISSGVQIDFYAELIKLQWNDILEMDKVFYTSSCPSLTELAKKAIFYNNSDFLAYLAGHKSNGSSYLSSEGALNFAIQLYFNGRYNGSPVSEDISKKYILYLLDSSQANPNIRDNEGKRPIDYVQGFPASDKKRELLTILFNHGAHL
jgi:hypothetical protein